MIISIKKTASPFMVTLAFATVYIVWGSTYFFIQNALKGFPPLLMGALRFLIAGILMLGWSMLRGEKIFNKEDIKRSVISGLLLLFVGTGVVIWVEQYLPSAFVAIIVSAAPIWFVLFDKTKWKENFSSRATLAGLIIGFVGVILLFSEKLIGLFSASGNHREIWAMALLIIGSISWTCGSLYSKYKPVSGAATVNIAVQMLAAGIAFLPGSFLLGEPQHLQWHTIPVNAWLSILYLVFFGSIAGFSAYVWLLQVRPATQVSTYAYVNPVVAILLGVFFAGEKVSLLQVLGLLIILGSVLMINFNKYRKTKITTTKTEASLKISSTSSSGLLLHDTKD